MSLRITQALVGLSSGALPAVVSRVPHVDSSSPFKAQVQFSKESIYIILSAKKSALQFHLDLHTSSAFGSEASLQIAAKCAYS
jgi:hypothetical protein